MTNEQKVIKNKIGLLRLAQELDNVSKACNCGGGDFWASQTKLGLPAVLLERFGQDNHRMGVAVCRPQYSESSGPIKTRSFFTCLLTFRFCYFDRF